MTVTLSLPNVTGNVPAEEPSAQFAFIDHFNLRRMYAIDEQALLSQTEAVKRNLDKAQEYGAGPYILFSRSFEHLINYDFPVEGLGDLTGIVHAVDSEHRARQAVFARYLNEVLDYAAVRGIKVIFHTNQFEFPDGFYDLAGDKLGGTARVCPGKQLAYDALEAKITEFFRKFPKCAGIQLTLSEAQVSPKACDCEACRNLTQAQRFAKVAEAAVRACKPLDKLVMIRTWGGFETKESLDLLPREVICSTKHTLPDFHLATPPNPVLGLKADRQEVEFDAWGEYSGYNFFPCYMGDQYAERIRLSFDRGVRRFGIRLNWDPMPDTPINPIFDRPFGNEANIYVFSHLIADPTADPDELLREYVANVYPESARQAAFELYKRSFDLQTLWLTWQGHNANDHSRVYRPSSRDSYAKRVKSQIGFAVPKEYADTRGLMDERRHQIDDAYQEAMRLITALGSDVPADWRHELQRGARNAWFVAQGNCDCMLMYAAHEEFKAGGPLPDLTALEKEIESRTRRWQLADPAMFSPMRGESPLRMLEEIRAEGNGRQSCGWTAY